MGSPGGDPEAFVLCPAGGRHVLVPEAGGGVDHDRLTNGIFQSPDKLLIDDARSGIFM